MPRTSRKNSAAHLHDKQSERDTRELRIDKVGVRGLRFPIQVRDKARSVQNTVANIAEILRSLQKKLNAATSHLEIEFPYFMSKKSPVSRLESLMDYIARFDATACGAEIDFVLTVKANVTT